MKQAILGIAMVLSLSFGTVSATPVSADTDQPLLDQLAQADSPQTASRLMAEIWQGWLGGYADTAQKDMMATGISELSAKKLDAAEQTFSRLIRANPAFTEAWNKRATVRFLQGDLEGSEADVYEVLAREPRHFGAISGLGLINLHRGDIAKAARAYELLLEVNPFSQNALKLLPRLKRELGISDL